MYAHMNVYIHKHTHRYKEQGRHHGTGRGQQACMMARRDPEAGWLRYAGTPPQLCMTTYLAVRGGLELSAVGCCGHVRGDTH